MIEDSRLFAISHAGTLGTPGVSTLRASQVSMDRRQLAAGMATTLSAELDGRVPLELVAEIVRAVLDESRRGAPHATAESAMSETRARLDRFIRARLPR